MTKEIDELIDDITDLEARYTQIHFMYFCVSHKDFFISDYLKKDFVNMFGQDIWDKLND